jgi:hypothetical protein
MTATGCFFSAEHQHNLLHKSEEFRKQKNTCVIGERKDNSISIQ